MKSFISTILIIANTISFAQLKQEKMGEKNSMSSHPLALNSNDPGLQLNEKPSLSKEKNNRTTHFIGQAFGGGVVYFVSADGTHGLIAETIDQTLSSNWYNAQENISVLSNHSTAGQSFTGWRLPTKKELELMYSQKSLIGGFADSGYWSSDTGDTVGTAWYQDFKSGSPFDGEAYNSLNVRAIREF